MKFAALISGGKDSIFNILECIAHGHELVAVVNMSPPVDHSNCAIEIDSYMYQSVGNEAVILVAQCLGVPIFQHSIKGNSVCQDLMYSSCKDDEVEDLYEVICSLIKRIPDVEALASGAILSDYQRNRVENVAHRLGLQSLAFLWRRSQDELLDDMIAASINAIIIKIASYGLDIEKVLGSRIAQQSEHFKQLSKAPFCLNVCGEGGEYETFTLNCPLFSHEICLNSNPKRVILSSDPCSPVAYLQLDDLSLKTKACWMAERLLLHGSEIHDFTECCLKNLRLLFNKMQDLHYLLNLRNACVICIQTSWLNDDVDDSLPKSPNDILTKPSELLALRSTSGHAPFIDPVARLYNIQSKVCSEISNDSVVFNNPSSCIPNSRLVTQSKPRQIPDNFAYLADGQFWITRNCSGSSVSEGCEQAAVRLATKNAFLRLKKLLDSGSVPTNHILHIVAMLNRPLDPDLFRAFNQVYTAVYRDCSSNPANDSFVGDLKFEPMTGYLPSRVCISVKNLASILNQSNTYHPDSVLVSLSAIVLNPSLSDLKSVRGLLVRSISHWAPSNIGPYSQVLSTSCSPLPNPNGEELPNQTWAFYSGQIGLIPELSVLPKSLPNLDHQTALEVESWLVLRHCHRIMKVMTLHIWTDLVIGICYATCSKALDKAKNDFHSTICSQWIVNHIKPRSDRTCFCQNRIVWVLVSDLPMHASIEWHLITQNDRNLEDHEEDVGNISIYTPHRLVPNLTLDGKQNRNVSIIFITDLAYEQHELLTWFHGTLIPVQGFLDPHLKSIGLIL